MTGVPGFCPRRNCGGGGRKSWDTGHKIFSRGCGVYLWGVRKNPTTSEGGTKKTTEPYITHTISIMFVIRNGLIRNADLKDTRLGN